MPEQERPKGKIKLEQSDKIEFGAVQKGKKEQKKEQLIQSGFTEAEIRVIKQKEKEELDKRVVDNPQSNRQKQLSNFFYHYKTHVFIGAFVMMLAGMLLKDLFFTTKPDLVVTMVGTKYVTHEVLEEMAAILAPVVGDLNGDGKEYVLIDNIQFPPREKLKADEIYTTADPETDAGSFIKLTAIIASGRDHLFLLDDTGFEFFLTSAGTDDIFVSLDSQDRNVRLLPFPDSILSESKFAYIFDDYFFCVRTPQRPDKPSPNYQISLEIVENFEN